MDGFGQMYPYFSFLVAILFIYNFIYIYTVFVSISDTIVPKPAVLVEFAFHQYSEKSAKKDARATNMEDGGGGGLMAIDNDVYMYL